MLRVVLPTNHRLTLSLFVAIFALLTSAKATPADNTIGSHRSSEMCPYYGASFHPYFEKLRAAVRTGNIRAVASLISFPLRVNEGGGFHLVNNEHDLAASYTRVFTPSIRKVILNQRESDLFCITSGIAFGRGSVWVQAVDGDDGARYAIVTVNIPDNEATVGGPSQPPALVFHCDAPDRLAIVDRSVGILRFREWSHRDKQRAQPDVIVIGGKETSEGTNVCAANSWAFDKGHTTYTVSELGCTNGSEPSGSTGRLTISRYGKTEASWFCR